MTAFHPGTRLETISTPPTGGFAAIKPERAIFITPAKRGPRTGLKGQWFIVRFRDGDTIMMHETRLRKATPKRRHS